MVHAAHPAPYRFDPARHRQRLAPLLAALAAAPRLDPRTRDRLLARHPKAGRGFFSKAELLAGLRWLRSNEPETLAGVDLGSLEARLRGKPVRTLSGVAVVTVLTRPHPCPGRCVFCPGDVRMPKSYLADEPGCQRAAAHRFDPYAQTLSRLRALAANGHPVDKVELLVLGGTWSSYPEGYRVDFVRRCFQALNDFTPADPLPAPRPPAALPAAAAGSVDGRLLHDGGGPRTYNRQVGPAAAGNGEPSRADWPALAAAHAGNEEAAARCVGLVLETRPDALDAAELLRLRRLGATRVQIGVQSLDDRVLARNLRGHDVAATRRAFRLLRAAGFKIQAHWMANLLGADPVHDRRDFRRLFTDPALRPDELKIYPCALLESAELMRYWQAGEWQPYDEKELLELVIDCMTATPEYCRLSRVVRDIPGTDIVAGSRVTNLRQVAEREMALRGVECRDIRAREVGRRGVERTGDLELRETAYATAVGEERFLELVTPGGRLAAFLRLSLPRRDATHGLPPELTDELEGAAVVREVHVYGRVAPLDGAGGTARRPQHRGLGRRLVRRAAELAAAAGHRRLAVISAVGTRGYYRRLGFADRSLYQHLELGNS